MDLPIPAERLPRAAVAVAASTLVLTACFLGVLALVRGAIAGFGSRFPIYVLAMAIAFVVAVFRVERRHGPDSLTGADAEGSTDGGIVADGRAILTTAVGVAAAAFVVVALAGEGVVYAARSPGDVLSWRLLPYLLAAGLIATGLGYWGLRHWREFATGEA